MILAFWNLFLYLNTILGQHLLTKYFNFDCSLKKCTSLKYAKLFTASYQIFIEVWMWNNFFLKLFEIPWQSSHCCSLDLQSVTVYSGWELTKVRGFKRLNRRLPRILQKTQVQCPFKLKISGFKLKLNKEKFSQKLNIFPDSNIEKFTRKLYLSKIKFS